VVKVNENIRFLRKKRGWTQEMFSKKIGIKRSLVGAYEEGRSDPRLNNLLKICDTFNISLDNILKKDVSINVDHSPNSPISSNLGLVNDNFIILSNG